MTNLLICESFSDFVSRSLVGAEKLGDMYISGESFCESSAYAEGLSPIQYFSNLTGLAQFCAGFSRPGSYLKYPSFSNRSTKLVGDEIKAGAGIDARLADGHFELRAGRVVANEATKNSAMSRVFILIAPFVGIFPSRRDRCQRLRRRPRSMHRTDPSQ